MGKLKEIVDTMEGGLFNIPPNITLLQETLGRVLSQTQIDYLKEYWNAFYNDPHKYAIYADMINETMNEKEII